MGTGSVNVLSTFVATLVLFIFVLFPQLAPPGCAPHHTVDVQRHFDSPAEATAIEVAEHAYPDRADVLAAARDAQDGVDADDIPEEAPWWYAGSNLRLPYAITIGAIEYYTDKVYQSRGSLTYSEGFAYSADAE